MKKKLISFILAGVVLALSQLSYAGCCAPAPSCCVDPCCCNWYVAASGSVAWHNKLKFSDGDSTDNIDYIDNSVSFKTGWGVNASIGYIFDLCCGWDFRLEAEYVYRKNDLKNDVLTIDGSTETFALSGHNQDSALMANLILDAPLCFCSCDAFSWYIGGGIGADWNKVCAGGDCSRDTLFAWQFLTGFSYCVCQNVSLTLGYRLFGTTKNNFTHHGIHVRHEPLTQSVDLGLRFRL